MTSSDHDNYEKSADGKFVTNADRPLSPYRKHFISINGESETEIANKKEKVLTGEINVCFVNCSVSLLYLLAFFSYPFYLARISRFLLS